MTALQWGHDASDVETETELDLEGYVFRLQWGRVFNDVENAEERALHRR